MSKLLIQASDVTKSFNLKVLFSGLSLSISENERFALIGENGSGKTTLLKILAESIMPDQGKIFCRPSLTIEMVTQETPEFPPGITVREFFKRGVFYDLEKKMSSLEEHLEDPDRLEEWGNLQEEYEKKGGYRQPPIEEFLHALKIDLELDVPIDKLSSGNQSKVMLAKALRNNSDLLLLDEPTNHLDQEMVKWLIEKLQLRKGAMVFVSHDRRFINVTCNRILELQDAKLTLFVGNYDFYLEEKKRLFAEKIKAYEKQEEERKELKQKIKSISFSKKKPKAPKDRNVMAYDRWGEHHQRSEKRTIDDLKAKLKKIEENLLSHPKPKTILGLHLSSVLLRSYVAIEYKDLSKSFGFKKIFSNFSRTLHKGDRIILQGANGSGKTTLLRMTMGLEEIDSGDIKKAPSAKFGYLDQDIELLPKDQSPIEYFSTHYHLSETELRSELHKSALGGFELLNTPFSNFSVGQRKRLMLLSLILSKPNVPLLDEPTNHLDLLTMESLENALLGFKGAILVVSHDPTFIDKIATDTWILD